jgi:hypothetical protein
VLHGCLGGFCGSDVMLVGVVLRLPPAPRGFPRGLAGSGSWQLETQQQHNCSCVCRDMQAARSSTGCSMGTVAEAEGSSTTPGQLLVWRLS